jgi:hypothetical protein
LMERVSGEVNDDQPSHRIDAGLAGTGIDSSSKQIDRGGCLILFTSDVACAHEPRKQAISHVCAHIPNNIGQSNKLKVCTPPRALTSVILGQSNKLKVCTPPRALTSVILGQ